MVGLVAARAEGGSDPWPGMVLAPRLDPRPVESRLHDRGLIVLVADLLYGPAGQDLPALRRRQAGLGGDPDRLVHPPVGVDAVASAQMRAQSLPRVDELGAAHRA